MSIDRILRDTEAAPLEMSVLARMAGKAHKARVIMFEKLENAKHLDEIINKTHRYAILLIYDKRTKDNRVGHYLAIFLRGPDLNEVVFFDSYGHRLTPLLKLLNHSNAVVRLIKESGKKLSMNRTALQSESEKISTCGRWAATRCRFADWSNEKFARFFKSKYMNPDQLVTMMTLVFAAGKDGHHDAMGGREIDHLLT